MNASGPCEFRNPRPKGPPGRARFGVTGISSISCGPGMGKWASSVKYGLSGTPRWSIMGRILHRFTHRPGSTDESAWYPRELRIRIVRPFAEKLGALKETGLRL